MKFVVEFLTGFSDVFQIHNASFLVVTGGICGDKVCSVSASAEPDAARNGVVHLV